MTPACSVTVQYMHPSPRLRRFFAGLFLIEVEVDGGGAIEDFMFPDWATLRFNHSPQVTGRTRDGEALPEARFMVSGPRIQETYLRTGTVRQWGALISPLGWASLIGEPASAFANGLFDGMTTAAFEKFRPLAETLFGPEPDVPSELQRLTEFLEGLEPRPEPAAEKIEAIFAALYNPEIDTVGALAQRVGVSSRTLERLCSRAFGFAPKVLLRRHRFLRSLWQFTADPSLKWIGAMDASYHDQAQFVRDFHEFMGMTPTAYSQLPKPIVEPVLLQRVNYARELTRGLLQAQALKASA
jgi:AraC-like DNA-binding protein